MATFALLLFTTNGGPVCNWRTCPFLKMSSYCRIAAFMKTIAKDELYENLSQFLKGKGVDLKEGQYTKGIHAGCSMLADAINLSQAGLERAKSELDRQLVEIRRVIHEKTARKKTPGSRGSGGKDKTRAATSHASGSKGTAQNRSQKT